MKFHLVLFFSLQNTLPPAGKLQKSGLLSHTWSFLPLITALLSDSNPYSYSIVTSRTSTAVGNKHQ